ncbi:hypothetical protein M2171_002587 [Bradyrhizobium japonicum USDA 38]|nr:hypothetical protein [Bradyrhizobium japonicum USDA 38]
MTTEPVWPCGDGQSTHGSARTPLRAPFSPTRTAVAGPPPANPSLIAPRNLHQPSRGPKGPEPVPPAEEGPLGRACSDRSTIFSLCLSVTPCLPATDDAVTVAENAEAPQKNVPAVRLRASDAASKWIARHDQRTYDRDRD